VAIVGAGVSGICLGVQLLQAGIDSFTIFEEADRPGGTWRDNTYPGLYCDVPSRYYSFSFAPHPGWSRVFAPGNEIQAYLEWVVDRFHLDPHIRYGTGVTRATWQDPVWEVELADGTVHTFDVVVSATGVLRDPNIPDIPGLDGFAGDWFHSARWNHDVPLEGRRIGVIGTGSTGVQITTALAGVAGRLDLYMRRPHWVLTVPNLPYTKLGHTLHDRVPALGRVAHRGWQKVFEGSFSHAATRPGLRRKLVHRAVRACLDTVKDPDLRAKLTPSDDPLCKRLIISGGFYREVQRPNVDVVTDHIDRIVPDGIVTADGVLHELDVLVLATGFHAQRFMRPMALTGRDGIDIDEAWAKGPRAYLTVALPGFPNFFMLQGPHSPTGNQSLIETAEAQSHFIRQAIEVIRDRQVSLAPTAAATDRFNDAMAREMPKTAWTSGCDSWYLDDSGLPTLWPFLAPQHRTALSRVRLDDFVVTPLAARTA
jgi:cation diffusion facilitator CzcD-associated flavoprotein CzcO